MFRIKVPLNEKYFFDTKLGGGMDGEMIAETGIKIKTSAKKAVKLSETERKIFELVTENDLVTQKELAEQIGLSNNGIRLAMKGLKDKGLLTGLVPIGMEAGD